MKAKDQTLQKSDAFILVEDPSQCCGCGACADACPRQAISMRPNEYGFVYPVIHTAQCVSCGICKKICAYQNQTSGRKPGTVYAAVSRDQAILRKSSSGGVFATLAKAVLEDNGYVCGCSMETIDGKLTPMMIMIANTEELQKLQGSKYVQSASGHIYPLVKEKLLEQRTVLFSGTPCQVAALKSYLADVPPEHLITIDLICHGTPSTEFFQSYIAQLERTLKGEVKAFEFRNKSKGWGFEGQVTLIRKRNLNKKSIHPMLSSYYMLFLSGNTYRDSCYSCKYAQEERYGDLTIGDFWEFRIEHQDAMVEKGRLFDADRGVSCILVNTEEGNAALEKYGTGLTRVKSTLQKIANDKGQLKRPVNLKPVRETILGIYKAKGYQEVEKWYFKRLGLKRYLYWAWYRLPLTLRNRLKG